MLCKLNFPESGGDPTLEKQGLLPLSRGFLVPLHEAQILNRMNALWLSARGGWRGRIAAHRYIYLYVILARAENGRQRIGQQPADGRADRRPPTA